MEFKQIWSQFGQYDWGLVYFVIALAIAVIVIVGIRDHFRD